MHTASDCSPVGDRVFSPSAEDTALLRKKFEYQSPLAEAGRDLAGCPHSYLSTPASCTEAESSDDGAEADELLARKHALQAKTPESPYRAHRDLDGTITPFRTRSTRSISQASYLSGPWIPGHDDIDDEGETEESYATSTSCDRQPADRAGRRQCPTQQLSFTSCSTAAAAAATREPGGFSASVSSAAITAEESKATSNLTTPASEVLEPAALARDTHDIVFLAEPGLHSQHAPVKSEPSKTWSISQSAASEEEPEDVPAGGTLQTVLRRMSQDLGRKAEEIARLANEAGSHPPPAATPADAAWRQLSAENEALKRELQRRKSGGQPSASAPLATCLRKVRADLASLKGTLAQQRGAALELRQVGSLLRDGAAEKIAAAYTAVDEAATDRAEAQLAAVIAHAQQLYLQAEAERKALHVKVMELKGTIRVVSRVRPLLAAEGADSALAVKNDSVTVERANGQRLCFTLDAVLPPDATQSDVFTEVADVTTSVLDGRNCCILAYGQTGSGKTHTMLGSKGVVSSVLQDIFAGIKRRESRGGHEYKLFVSISEVYNDSMKDLLAETKIDTVQTGRSFASEFEIMNAALDIKEVLSAGERSRAVGVSNANERSSRSHCAILARVEGLDLVTHERIHGQVYLVDLAGSERIPTSSAAGSPAIAPATLRETQHINKSLSALGDVVEALGCNRDHIPYRNSRLTHLLQPCLRKGSKVVVIVTVSPSPTSISESICSLQFAVRTRSVHLGEAKKQSSRPVATPRLSRSSQKQNRSRSAPNLNH
ncbi:Kinesin-2 [Diplonema papillatum]|nr:Kinesin-2 [Diplonema papillatum]